MWASAPKSPTADWVLLSPQARELETQEEELRCRDAFYKEQLGRLERQVGPAGPGNPPPRSALGGGLASSDVAKKKIINCVWDTKEEEIKDSVSIKRLYFL